MGRRRRRDRRRHRAAGAARRLRAVPDRSRCWPARRRRSSPGSASIQETMDGLLPALTAGQQPSDARAGRRSMAPMLTGDVDGARRGLAGLGDRPDPWLRAAARMFSGQLELNDGRHRRGRGRSWTAGCAAFREIGDRWGLIVTLTGLAEVAMARAQPAEAVRLLERGPRLRGRGPGQEPRRDAAGSRWAGPGRWPATWPEPARTWRRGSRLAGRIGEHDDEAGGYVELSELARREGDLAAAADACWPARWRSSSREPRTAGHAGRGRDGLQRRRAAWPSRRATWTGPRAGTRGPWPLLAEAGPMPCRARPATRWLAAVRRRASAGAGRRPRGEHAAGRRAARPGRTRCTASATSAAWRWPGPGRPLAAALERGATWRRPTPAAGRSAGPTRWPSSREPRRPARRPAVTPGGRTSAWPSGT